MALPQTLNPNSPTGSDNPSGGDDELRGIKQYLVDVYGAPNNSAIDSAAFSLSTSGRVTVLQPPLTVPSVVLGPPSRLLQIRSQYTSLSLGVGSTNFLFLTDNQRVGVLRSDPNQAFHVGTDMLVDGSLEVGLSGLLVNGRVYVRGNSGFAGYPRITVALGDNDTGFHWINDGIYAFYTNNVEAVRLTPTGLLPNTVLSVNWGSSGRLVLPVGVSRFAV